MSVAVAVMAAVYLIAVLAISPFLSQAIFHAVDEPAGTDAGIGEGSGTEELRKLTLAIRGMYCPACPAAVEYELESVEGVVDASVSYPDGIAIVIYRAPQVSKETIAGALRPPYSATIISDAPA
jgi:copper chaperone CopZ